MKSLVINKDDLRHNIKVIKDLAKLDIPNDNGEKYKLIGVVKGNGYGLGLIEYSKFLIDNGIETLAVATLEEAVELRKEAKIKEDILMMSSTSIEEDLKTLIENDVIITIGMYSHFSLAYYKNDKWTIEQFNRFINVIETLKLNDINIKMYHMCNSPAFLNYPEMQLNGARIGSAFLGRVDAQNNVGLKKIGQLKTNITEIKTVPKGYNIGYLNSYTTKKETKVAIIQVGYMDGYNITMNSDMFRFVDKLRALSHSIKSFMKKTNLKVTINDEKYNVIGKVGMYHLAIDVTDSNIKVNDIVYLDVNPLHVDGKIRREYV